MSVAAKKHSGLKRKFTVQAAPGSEVYLAGCFTGWREREIPLKDDGNGNFEVEVELERASVWARASSGATGRSIWTIRISPSMEWAR